MLLLAALALAACGGGGRDTAKFGFYKPAKTKACLEGRTKDVSPRVSVVRDVDPDKFPDAERVEIARELPVDQDTLLFLLVTSQTSPSVTMAFAETDAAAREASAKVQELWRKKYPTQAETDIVAAHRRNVVYWTDPGQFLDAAAHRAVQTCLPA